MAPALGKGIVAYSLLDWIDHAPFSQTESSMYKIVYGIIRNDTYAEYDCSFFQCWSSSQFVDSESSSVWPSSVSAPSAWGGEFFKVTQLNNLAFINDVMFFHTFFDRAQTEKVLSTTRLRAPDESAGVWYRYIEDNSLTVIIIISHITLTNRMKHIQLYRIIGLKWFE